ncbi:MAG: 10-formyltetrahydrofolate:L-methionyl-tRNA(fMet) N-formyltransferase [Candidatus Eisenbacteria bacterium]|jgi:methionyl-tRNA formyltransferase
MGTPEFSVPALRAVAAACDVVTVVTQPDRPKGRGQQTTESPVAQCAHALGIPVMRPLDMKAPEVRDALAALAADVFAVVAFGSILTPEVLALPRAGCVNLHGSLLPDYRGASPVQRALWDGLAETGVCTIVMDAGIDTGDVVLSRTESIRDDDDAASLAARLAELGGPLLAESCVLLHEGRAPRTPQDRAAGSYAKKLKKQDGVADWTLPARVVWSHARAVTPWPGATTMFRGKRVLIVRSRPETGGGEAAPGTLLGSDEQGLRVACGDGVLRVTRLKPEGRAELDAAEWARGARIQPDERFEHLKEQTT